MINKKILFMLWMCCIAAVGDASKSSTDCLMPNTDMEIRVYFGMTGDKSCEITLNPEMANRYNKFLESTQQELDDATLLEYVRQKVQPKLPLECKFIEQGKPKFKLTYKVWKNHFCKADQGLRIIFSRNKGCFDIVLDDQRIFFNLRGDIQLILHINTDGATEIGFYTCMRDLSGSKVEVITTSSREGILGSQWTHCSILELLCKFKKGNPILDSETFT